MPRTYDAEFRRRVVELVWAGRPVRVVAAELELLPSCPAMSGHQAPPPPRPSPVPSGGSLLVGLAPLGLGRQWQRATSKVATWDDRAGIGPPYGHGLSTADEVGAHRYGVVQDRSGRGRLCWHATKLQAVD